MSQDRRSFLATTTAALAAIAPVSAQPAPAPAAPDRSRAAGPAVRRRFLRIGGRDLFFQSAGAGPPIVLVHGSPGDSSFFARDIPVLAAKYSVFAFDSPGFGRSDVLPEAQRDVAYMADVIAQGMAALGIPEAVVYGSHTGAAVAAELAARHPALVGAVLLDGFPIFTDEELDSWFRDFLPPLVPDKQGGHFSSVWTRCRDQGIWFPWSFKHPDHLLGQGVPPVARIQTTALSIMRCGRTYVPAFRSALAYGRRVPGILARISQPTMITCAQGDPLSAHLDRLPPLGPNQAVAKLPTGEAVRALRDDWFARHAGDYRMVPPAVDLPAGDGIAASIVELADGREVFLRVAGRPDRPALLLIHDAPGSSQRHLAAIAALSAHARVYAIDLPGCGETEAAGSLRPAMADYAIVVRATMAALGVERAVIHGIGFGASVAIEFAATYPAATLRLVLQSVLLPAPAERMDMVTRYAPPMMPQPDGSHWYATWLMLRDSLAFWPWYRSGSAAGLRRVDLADAFDADLMHDWTVEVVKQLPTYHQVIDAALAQDAAAQLARVKGQIVICTDPRHPFQPYDATLAALLPGARRVACRGDAAADAREIARAAGVSG